MYRKILTVILAVTILLAGSSCKKYTVDEQVRSATATPSELAAVKTWLMTSQSSSSNSAWVKEMTNSVDWSKCEKVPLSLGETLLVFPISIEVKNTVTSRRLTKANSSTKNVLSMILTDGGTVKEGMIMQLTPTAPATGSSTANVIQSVYTKSYSQFTGAISQFSVDHHFVCEMQFQNGRLKGESRIKNLPKRNTASVRTDARRLDQESLLYLTSRAPLSNVTNRYRMDGLGTNGNVKSNDVDCWDFYLIHYEYDGENLTTTVTYLGTLCGLCDANGVLPEGGTQKIKVNCGNGGGGGSSDPNPDLVDHTGMESVNAMENDYDETTHDENGDTPDGSGSSSIIYWPRIKYVFEYELDIGYNYYGLPIRILSIDVFPGTVMDLYGFTYDTEGHPCMRRLSIIGQREGGYPLAGPTAWAWWEVDMHADYYHNGVSFPSRNWTRTRSKVVTP